MLSNPFATLSSDRPTHLRCLHRRARAAFLARSRCARGHCFELNVDDVATAQEARALRDRNPRLAIFVCLPRASRSPAAAVLTPAAAVLTLPLSRLNSEDAADDACSASSPSRRFFLAAITASITAAITAAITAVITAAITPRLAATTTPSHYHRRQRRLAAIAAAAIAAICARHLRPPSAPAICAACSAVCAQLPSPSPPLSPLVQVNHHCGPPPPPHGCRFATSGRCHRLLRHRRRPLRHHTATAAVMRSLLVLQPRSCSL